MSNSVAKQKLAALAAGHEPAMPPRNCRHCGITLFRSPNATEDVTNCQLSGNGTLLPSKFAITEAVPRQSCRAGANDGFENFSAEIHQLDIAIDSVKILSAGLGGPEWTGRNRLGPNRAKNEQNMLDKMKVVVHIQGGSIWFRPTSPPRPRRFPKICLTRLFDANRIGQSEAYPNSRSCGLPDR
jgi:hypothetical protein